MKYIGNDTVKRKLAKEARYKSSDYERTQHAQEGRRHSIDAMERLTAEHFERVDPGGERARALLKEMQKEA